jgi:hypothetical protein
VLQPVPAEEVEQLADPLAPDPKPPQHPRLVVLVGDSEAAAEARRAGVLPQDRETEPVQGAAGDLLGGCPQRQPEPARDLVGRLVGEGDRADPARLHAQPADEVLDPADEAEGLPRPRPGDDQHGTGRSFDGAELGG